MPAPRSSRSATRSGGTGKTRQGSGAKRSTQSRGRRAKGAGSTKGTRSKGAGAGTKAAGSPDAATSERSAAAGDGLRSLMEQLVNRVIRPLGLVMLSREGIQETLDDAAERGRMTRADANALVAELVRRGREQTDEMLVDFEQLLGRGRSQLGQATRRARHSEPVDQLVRAADRARRSVGIGSSSPIAGYDELTASQVTARLDGLTAADLRTLRDYEGRHANRKSVLEAIEKALET